MTFETSQFLLLSPTLEPERLSHANDPIRLFYELSSLKARSIPELICPPLEWKPAVNETEDVSLVICSLIMSAVVIKMTMMCLGMATFLGKVKDFGFEQSIMVS